MTHPGASLEELILALNIKKQWEGYFFSKGATQASHEHEHHMPVRAKYLVVRPKNHL